MFCLGRWKRVSMKITCICKAVLFSGYPENYQISLKCFFFQSIKRNDEFQFPAVAFVVQKETESEYSCATLYFPRNITFGRLDLWFIFYSFPCTVYATHPRTSFRTHQWVINSFIIIIFYTLERSLWNARHQAWARIMSPIHFLFWKDFRFCLWLKGSDWLSVMSQVWL